jgi:hypothetical protein
MRMISANVLAAQFIVYFSRRAVIRVTGGRSEHSGAPIRVRKKVKFLAIIRMSGYPR